MHVVDGDTGNELSGITITDTTTLETHPSACGGASFIDAPADDFTTDAGIGTDCITSNGHVYDASTNPAEPPADITLTVFRDFFFLDEFNGTIATPLSAHTPDVGGAWTVEAGSPEIQLTGSSAATMPGLGDTRYSNAQTPPGADYRAIMRLSADVGYSDQTFILARQNGPANTYYYALADLAGVLILGKVLAGINTPLATGTFTMPPLGGGNVAIIIDCTGTTISALVDFAPVLSVTDASITAPGTIGVRQTRSVGQPVLIDQILGF